MLHARPGPSRRARAVPVLLLSACTLAFGGLVALSPSSGDEPAVLAYTSADVTPLVLEAPAEERATARASRSRRLDEQARAAAAAKAKAAAQAKAAAEVAAKAKAAAEAAAKAKAAAEAKAKAKAAAAKRASRTGALRINGRCPVPSSSFTDTWGAPRSGGRAHKGTDMLAPYGSPVYAVAAGVVRTDTSGTGGLMLYIDADNGETYAYLHNSANLVKGGRVVAGQLVARVGSTGNAGNTNHVHFEREVGGRNVNPYPFVRRLC